MLEKSKKGIIAEGDPASLKKNSSNPLVRRFFNRRTGIESLPMEQGAENIINAFT
jgi:phospholipid/cholesterol/gamma-HCH transport system ATP-binding protein